MIKGQKKIVLFKLDKMKDCKIDQTRKVHRASSTMDAISEVWESCEKTTGILD